MRGFAFIELIVVMGIVATLMTISFPSLITSQRRASISETAAVLLSDIKSQQTKAMFGDSQTSPTPTQYGVYFQADSYVLFNGSTYVPADPANFTVNLDPSLRFSSVTYPGSQIVFARGSGEIPGFVSDTYDLSLTDQSEAVTRIITINRYGVVTQIN